MNQPIKFIYALLIITIVGSGVALELKYQVSVFNTNQTIKEIVPQKKITSDEAIKLVREFSEVKEWLKVFSTPDYINPKTRSHAFVEIEHETDTNYIVWVYSVVHGDGDIAGHAVTHGFYAVDFNTAAVRKVDLEI